MLEFRKRPVGPDSVQPAGSVAVDRRPLDPRTGQPLIDQATGLPVDWEFVDYAKTEADADGYIRTASDPHAHEHLFFNPDGTPKRRNKHTVDGDTVQATLDAADRFAEHAKDATPQDVRHQQRRSKAFEDLMVKLSDRPQAGNGSDFVSITWEEAARFHKEYADAVASGEQKRSEFQPLSAYAHKIIQTNDDGTVKRVLRKPFANEFGILEPREGSGGKVRYLILKDQGPGDAGGKYFQVPTEGGKVSE